MTFEFEREYDRNFIGREKELEWLDERLYRRSYSFSPIFVSGPSGVGKTALVNHWFSSRRISYTPLWLDLSSNIEDNAIDNLMIEIRKISDDRYEREGRLTVVIDGTDVWSQKKHEEEAAKIFNYKIVSSLVFIKQKALKFPRGQHLSLNPLSNSSTGDLLRKLLSSELTDAQVSQAIEASKGFPLALSILSKLIQGDNIDGILSSTKEPLYDIQNGILLPKKQIITTAQPIIINANHKLIESLKKQPVNIRSITPREFEELLADLLRDMGWDVELTKQTRDGGSDILAYLNTEVGRLLCLVEAKHYREDRKIGVELVRTLYGTLCDAQANSAMLVTSSSFTADAKTFQQKHQYQLTLRDYADVVEWIMKFGTKKNNFV
ncbi:MAG TPA: restriction endonuclease [Bacteroidia bacterium]|nr:restriction endonuclease [Bacteroidia bacterium]